MTFKTHSFTKVQCDERDHKGDPVHLVEHAHFINASEALQYRGWHYTALTATHTCPVCTTRLARRN